MTAIRRNICVHFGLQVHFADGVFQPSNPLLLKLLAGTPKPSAALVVLDAGLARAQPSLPGNIAAYFSSFPRRLRLVCPPLVVAGGERAKNSIAPVNVIHAEINRRRLDRHSYVVGVGGGALLDVAGFAAATAHRGLRHVRIPTTTLSQCDSGVGVKNGINAFGRKNFIGTFAPPYAVINDFQLLSSLSDRDRRAGCAEAVKVALIRDRDFFGQLELDAALLAGFAAAPLRRMIRRCAQLHMDHIALGGDPFETGVARPLDFGHWAAHKLEQLSAFRIRHGEAVAAGVALDVLYSRQAGLLKPAAAGRALALLEALGFQLFAGEMLVPDSSGQPALLQGLEEFREHLGGQLSLTLLRDIGRSVQIAKISRPGMLRALHALQLRCDPRAANKPRRRAPARQSP